MFCKYQLQTFDPGLLYCYIGERGWGSWFRLLIVYVNIYVLLLYYDQQNYKTKTKPNQLEIKIATGNKGTTKSK